MFGNSLTITCENCGSSIEKSPVNQQFQLIWNKNGFMFKFPQNGKEETDLPWGIGFLEFVVYILIKRILFF